MAFKEGDFVFSHSKNIIFKLKEKCKCGCERWFAYENSVMRNDHPYLSPDIVSVTIKDLVSIPELTNDPLIKEAYEYCKAKFDLREFI